MVMICKLKTKAEIFGVVSGKIGGKYLYMRSTSKKACEVEFIYALVFSSHESYCLSLLI